jgi:Spy/CpxP family protein refolding chaperone
MQSRAWTLSGLVGVAALAGALIAAAQPQDRPMHGPPGRGGPDGARYLDLTADQKAQIQELRQAQRPQLQELAQKLRDSQKRLHEALEAPSPDPAAVGTIAIEGHELQKQMRKLHEDADAAVRALLTPEQQVKFDALQSLRRERGPMGPMGPRGGAPLGPPPGEQP